MTKDYSTDVLRSLLASFPDVPVEWSTCDVCGDDLTTNDEKRRGSCDVCYEAGLRAQREVDK